MQRALPRASPSTSSAASGKPAACRSSSRSCRLGEIEPAADRHALPQPRQHGRRGVDPRQSDRRRRAALRLRQDDAVAGDGRGQLRPAGDRRLRRADAERQVPRPGHRLGHRRLALQRGGARPADEPRAVHGGRSRACRARPAPASSWARRRRWRRWSRRWGSALPHNAAIPAVDSRRYALAHLAGRRIVELVQRGRAALADPDARGVRERDPRQRRGRRIDQRRHPPAGDRRPRRRAAVARGLGRRSAATCRRSST